MSKRVAAVLFVCFVMVVGSACAQGRRPGVIAGVWSDGGQWSSGVPNQNSNVIIVSGSYSSFTNSGTLTNDGLRRSTLAGAVNTVRTSHYVPVIGSSFDIHYFTPGSLPGTFGKITGAMHSKESSSVIYDNSDGYVQLKVISTTQAFATPTPEPASLVLLGAGVLAVAGVLRRKLIR